MLPFQLYLFETRHQVKYLLTTEKWQLELLLLKFFLVLTNQEVLKFSSVHSLSCV